MPADSRLEGVGDLTAKLNELGVKLAAKELRGVARDALELAEHRARARMPQGSEPHKTYTGRLVSPGYALSTLHIETRLNKRSGAAEAILGVAGEAFYATAFVELGTSRTPAQPWLRPSFEEAEDPMLKQIGKSLFERIEKTRKSGKRAEQRARGGSRFATGRR